MKKTIETKIAKNGTKMYYVEGKRVNREVAEEIESKQAIERRGNLVENTFAEYEKKSSALVVTAGYQTNIVICFDSYLDFTYTRNYSTCEDAINAVNFFKTNFYHGSDGEFETGNVTREVEAERNGIAYSRVLHYYMIDAADSEGQFLKDFESPTEANPDDYAVSQEAMDVAVDAETELANSEAQTSTPIINIADYNTMMTWAEKISNGQRDAVTPIKTYLSKLGYTADINEIFAYIEMDDLNGFRRYISQFPFLVKDDAGYIQKLYAQEDGQVVLAEIPTCEYPSTENNTAETIEQTIEHKEETQMAPTDIIKLLYDENVDEVHKTHLVEDLRLASPDYRAKVVAAMITEKSVLKEQIESLKARFNEIQAEMIQANKTSGATFDWENNRAEYHSNNQTALTLLRRVNRLGYTLKQLGVGYPEQDAPLAIVANGKDYYKERVELADKIRRDAQPCDDNDDVFSLIPDVDAFDGEQTTTRDKYWQARAWLKRTISKGKECWFLFGRRVKKDSVDVAALLYDYGLTPDKFAAEDQKVIDEEQRELAIRWATWQKEWFAEYLADKIKRDSKSYDDNGAWNLIPNVDGNDDDDTDDELIDPPVDKEPYRPFTVEDTIESLNHSINWAKDTLATMTGDTYTDNIGETFTRNQLEQLVIDWQDEIADLQPQADKTAEPPKPVELVAPTVMSALETINAMFPLDGFVEDVSKPNFRSAVNGDWRLNIFIDKNGTPEAVSLAEDDQLFLTVKIKARSLRDSINRAIKTCVKNRIAYRKNHNAEMQKYEYELMHLLQAARRELEVA